MNWKDAEMVKPRYLLGGNYKHNIKHDSQYGRFPSRNVEARPPKHNVGDVLTLQIVRCQVCGMTRRMYCCCLCNMAAHKNDNINSMSCPWTFAEIVSNAHHRYYNTYSETADILTAINWVHIGIKWHAEASWSRSKLQTLQLWCNI